MISESRRFAQGTRMGVPSKVRKIDKEAKVRFLPAEEARTVKSSAETANKFKRGFQGCSANDKNALTFSSKHSNLGHKSSGETSFCSMDNAIGRGHHRLQTSGAFQQKNVCISDSVDAMRSLPSFPSNDSENQSTKSTKGNEDRPGKEIMLPQKQLSFRGILKDTGAPSKEVRASNGWLEDVDYGLKHSSSLSQKPVATSIAGKEIMLPQKQLSFRSILKDDVAPSEKVQASNGWLEHVDCGSKHSSPLSQKPEATSSAGTILPAGTNSNHARMGESCQAQISPAISRIPLNSPALKVIWKGNFEIRDCPSAFRSCEGILAHPSAKISRKAYSFSKLLAGDIQFMMFYQHQFWPDTFQMQCPNRNDIALYFYPRNHERSKRQYASLLKLIEKKGFMLRSRMGNIQLLVFPSKLLDADSQKLGGSYFMWGVFHRIKGKTSACNARAQSSSLRVAKEMKITAH